MEVKRRKGVGTRRAVPDETQAPTCCTIGLK